VRVETAFNRVLALEGAFVTSVSFTEGAVIAHVRRRARRHRCPCGWSTWARYDLSRRRWRHLDLGASPLWLEADIARIDCLACGRVRTEVVPWARPGAHCSRDVEDTIAWLAQRMDKSAITKLMRCAWRTVDNVVKRLVGEHLDADVNQARLEGLVRIGVDEISYKRGHKYLTVIADHDTGRVVWVAQGRTKAAFEEFTTALGPERCALIRAITMDMSPIYIPAAAATLPNARICFDPFHVIKWVNQALDSVFARIRENVRNRYTENGLPTRTHWRTARFLLRRGREHISPGQQEILDEIHAEDQELARAWELKEGLRDLYQHARTLEPFQVRTFLFAWIDAAENSGIKAFINLAKRINNHLDGIVAAVQLGLSNSRLEGINSRIRVIQRRGFGHPDPASLVAMIYLCMSGITPKLPT